MDIEQIWQVTKSHLGENGQPVAIEVEDPDGWLHANVRWDGCMEIHLHTKTEEGNVRRDVIHTCDLPGLIDKLSQLCDLSRQSLGANGYWSRINRGDDNRWDTLVLS